MFCRRQVWPSSQPGMVRASPLHRLHLSMLLYLETSSLNINKDLVTSNSAALGCFTTCATSIRQSILPSLTQNLNSRLMRSSSLLVRLKLALQLASNLSSQSKEDSYRPSCDHPICHRSHSDVSDSASAQADCAVNIHAYSDNGLWSSDCAPQQQASAGPATISSSQFCTISQMLAAAGRPLTSEALLGHSQP